MLTLNSIKKNFFFPKDTKNSDMYTYVKLIIFLESGRKRKMVRNLSSTSRDCAALCNRVACWRQLMCTYTWCSLQVINLTIAIVPDCRRCDLGPTEIQRPKGICSSTMSQMPHCNLHVLFWERLVGEIQLLKAMAPFLCEHVDAFVWCHHDIAIEIQPPV